VIPDDLRAILSSDFFPALFPVFIHLADFTSKRLIARQSAAFPATSRAITQTPEFPDCFSRKRHRRLPNPIGDSSAIGRNWKTGDSSNSSILTVFQGNPISVVGLNWTKLRQFYESFRIQKVIGERL
jgi:hypothetical protein